MKYYKISRITTKCHELSTKIDYNLDEYQNFIFLFSSLIW